MTRGEKIIGVVGHLRVSPVTRLSLPARRLLAYLALRGGLVSRQNAVDELWPDLPEETGRANLRRSLWQVPRPWIEVVGDDLMLDAECDLPIARRIVARAIAGEPLEFEDIDLLAQDLLPGWHDEWVLAVQEEFHLIRVQALEAACRSLAREGQFALAIRAGTAAVSAEPLLESAAEALICAHFEQGNRFAAMQCFRALASRLNYELGIEPDVALARRVKAQAGPRPAILNRTFNGR